MQKRDPKPEIKRLEELVLQVRSGEIKLPKFQRPFVWKESDIIKLFDSVYKGYPIGSLLLWNSSQVLVSEREVFGVGINTDGSNGFPTNYLLDGQQRLTSLCGALFWSGDDESSKWNIGFNLDTESFHQMKSAPGGNYFPLNSLLDTRLFLKACSGLEERKGGYQLIERAENLLRAVKDYKLAAVVIGDMTVQEVAPIFERINSTGRKLTIVDLMMAATWSEGFDLNSEITRVQEACLDLGYDEIPSKIILRSLSTSADLGINRDDIQKLRKLSSKDLKALSHKTRKSIIRAIEFFSERVKARDFSYIPYALQFNYITEFFSCCDNPDEKDLRELEGWIWYTSATRYFGTSNSGQNSKDLQLVRDFSSRKRSKLFDRKTIDISRLLFDRFNLRNATSTSFSLILGYKSPKLSADNRSIEETYKYTKNSKFYASCIPKSNDLYAMNISFLVHPFPGEKMVNVDFVEEERDDLFISSEAMRSLEDKDYNSFMKYRAECIADFIREKTGCKVVYDVPRLEGSGNLFEDYEGEDPGLEE